MTAIQHQSATSAPQPAPLSIRTVDSVGSTNDELMATPLRQPPAGPQVLWAHQQTSGHGRRGRQWVSRPGDSLTFSIACERLVDERSRSLAGISLAVGVALAEALEQFDCHLELKWPNDLYCAGRKVGGILVETRRERELERVVFGVGLNLVNPGALAAPTPGEPAATAPGGLFERPVAPPVAQAIVATCAAAVVAAWGEFIANGFAAFRKRWISRDAFRGERVQLHDGARLLAVGEAAGLGDSGELRLIGPEGERLFTIGDVSLRRDQAA